MPSQPDSDNRENSGGKRFLIAAGTSQYLFYPDKQLPSVRDDLDRIEALFREKLGYKRVDVLGENPSKATLEQQLSGWLQSEDRSPSDVIVFYYSGHGTVVGGEHYLLTRESDPTNLTGSAFLTSNLGRYLLLSKIQQFMVILDTCYAAAGSAGFTSLAYDCARSLWAKKESSCGFFALAAARPKDEAQPSVFSKALTNAVENSGDVHAEYLPVHRIVAAVNSDFEKKNLKQRASLDTLSVQTNEKFFPNLSKTPGLDKVDKIEPPKPNFIKRRYIYGFAIFFIIFVLVFSGVKLLPLDGGPLSGPTSKHEASQAKTKPLITEKEIPGAYTAKKANIRMVLIKSKNAVFRMGASGHESDDHVDALRKDRDHERPQHHVKFTHDLWVSEHEVTQRSFDMAKKNSARNTSLKEGLDLPVGVMWADAVLFCNELSEREGLCPYYKKNVGGDFMIPKPGADGYRLLTEAEWEFVARGGTDTPYWFGDTPDNASKNAWFKDNSDDKIHRVGTAELDNHPYGVKDINGNVWEWCWDYYSVNAYQQLARNPLNLDPLGPPPPLLKDNKKLPDRVLRGGSYNDSAISLRVTHRNFHEPTAAPDAKVLNWGFRVARTVISGQRLDDQLSTP